MYMYLSNLKYMNRGHQSVICIWNI